MSPGPLARLKPYFKTRPRVSAGAVPATPVAEAVPAPPASAPVAAGAPPRPSPADHRSLAARREQLSREYAELQSDLGGLVYEMAIRDSFRHDVLVSQAAKLQAVDAELSSIEQGLGIVSVAPASAPCGACGSPAPVGSAFCGSCGSPLGRPAPVDTANAPPGAVAAREGIAG